MADLAIGSMLDLVIASWRFLRWPLAAMLYIALGVSTLGLGFVYVLGIIVYAYVAIAADRRREAAGSDDFRGTALFYRYGRRIGRSSFSIPLQRQWSSGDAVRIAAGLRDGVAQRVQTRLQAAAEVIAPQTVRDLDDPGDGGKDLVRVCLRSRRGSLLVHFLHFAPVVESVTAHHFTFLRGTHGRFDEFRFAFFSPISIWLWGWPWMMNRLSILSHLSMTVHNSFDDIDLQSLLEASNHVIGEALEAVLEANGLLTDALRQVIVNNTYNNQRVDLRHATGFRMGSIANATGLPAAVA